jgi:hypothetical protein
MKRKLVLLNLVLAALAAAAAWQLRVRWLEDKAQQQLVLRRPARKADTPPAAALRAIPPVSASSYGEVAQRTLFSEDRNPDVTVEVAPPKPMPALPAAYGVMDFGSGPTVFMSEKPGGASRGYAPGEKVGEFTLVSVGEDEVVLEWNGQKMTKKMQELKPTAGEKREAASGEAVRPAVPVAQASNPSTEQGPGPQASEGGIRSCAPGDTSPAGTVRDGYRKVTNRTPFGSTCHWEAVK